MAADLYRHIETIEAQCRLRKFSKAETDALLRLCPYAFVSRYPARQLAPRPNGGRVISAV